MTLLARKPHWSPKLMDAGEGTPEIGWVPIGELHVDWLTWDTNGRPHGYQRPLDETRLDKIEAEFDPKLLGVAALSRRADGSLWVMDAQHRIEVLRRLGKSVVLGEIHDGLTPQQEADYFYSVNDKRKALNQWTKFGARGASGDRRVEAIIELTRSFGFKVGSPDRSLQSIAAVGTLERIYGWPDGPRLLRAVLGKIRDVWATDVVTRDGVFIEGLAKFTYTWDGSFAAPDDNTIDWSRFDSLFSKVRAVEVTRKCKAMKIEAGFEMNGTTYAAAIREIYNGKSSFRGRLVGPVLAPRPSGSGHKATQSYAANRVRARR